MSIEMWKNIGYVIGGAIVIMWKPMLDVLLKKRKILWANAKMLSQTQICRILTDIRARYNIDRVDIIEFTNSEMSLNNVPFIFGNMTFEVPAPHIHSIKSEYQRFATSWYAPIYAPLIPTTAKTVLWKETGEYIVNGKDVMMDESAGIYIVGRKLKSQLIIKFTQNIGDGILSLSSYGSVEEISKEDYNILLSDIHQIWFHLKLKR